MEFDDDDHEEKLKKRHKPVVYKGEKEVKKKPEAYTKDEVEKRFNYKWKYTPPPRR